jgi:hypothetical protein
MLRRDRVAGTVALAVLVPAAGVAIVLGAGASAVHTTLADVGAWLTNRQQGSVTHANGLSGQPDAQVTITDAQGHQLRVLQDGDVVIVQDLTTGVVSRIDPAQLRVTQSSTLSTAGAQVVVGHGRAYVVDPEEGYVQRIDPQQLSAVGGPVVLGGPLGQAAIDGQGTLWVPRLSTGEVVPVTDAGAATSIAVGSAGDPMQVTVANGTAVAVDAANHTCTTLGPDGAGRTVTLPVSAQTLLMAESSDSPLVPIVVGGSAQMVVVDTDTGLPVSVSFQGAEGDALGAPEVLGDRVYVPDDTTGRLIVYDAVSNRLLNQIPITDRHPTHLDLFVKDGLLWVNDADGSEAASIESSGVVHKFGKYGTEVPGGPSPSPSAAPTTATSGQGDGQGGSGGQSSTGNGPPTSAPPPRTTTPPPTTTAPPGQPPQSVREIPQPNAIVVTFDAPAAPTPTRYVLAGLPAGAQVDKSEILPGQTYQFTVTGLTCEHDPYAFTVVAEFPSGSKSATGTPARPCVAPGKPVLNASVPGQRTINTSWTEASDGGGIVTFQVSWGAGNSGWISGTSYQITSGLLNFHTYTVSVTARNAAGSGPASNSKSIGVTPGRTWSGTIYNNSALPVNVRAQPNTGAQIITQYPKGGGQTVTVLCVRNGGPWADPSGSPSGDRWYKVTNGYIAVGYVNVANSGSVWECDGT